MNGDKFKLSLMLSALAVTLLDIAYIIYLGIQISRVRGGIGAPDVGFGGFSVSVIAINAALLCYAIVYLIFRKR
ncbi:MAG TPA: hypothetical protein PKH08_00370 [Clostridia bacterium]|jgi:hypothetical protein|nr:hypothetical protein [Clostridia bacterium]HOK82030.1 hypothetical protein [Clostridia bacterium]HOL61464.1 hypothetical protein [Clostridia bacterium]HPO53675.1 hypothetical protein [Clostridia bacterium]